MEQTVSPRVGRGHLFELMRQDCKAGAVKALKRRKLQSPIALRDLEIFRERAERSFQARPESHA